jgi:hypothetical protein
VGSVPCPILLDLWIGQLSLGNIKVEHKGFSAPLPLEGG